MNRSSTLLLGFFAGLSVHAHAAASRSFTTPRTYYLPGADAARVVTVTKTGEASRDITVLTEAVAIKETGPKDTVAKFGEVYSFSLARLHRGAQRSADAPSLLEPPAGQRS